MNLAEATPASTVSTTASSSSPRFPKLAALFLFTLLMNLAGTWILPLVDRDEPFYAEVSREMNQRGDYLSPCFNGKFWMEKTPLLYWGQSLGGRLLGDSDFTARLPTSLAASITTLLVFGFCTRLYGTTVAWRAAISFSLCLEMLMFGKAGTPDTLLMLCCTVTFWSGWELLQKGGAKWWWLFYLSLAGAFYAKGPLLILPIGAIILYAYWVRPPRFFHTMKFALGGLMAAAIIALWLVPELVVTHGEFYRVFFYQHVFERFIKPDHGHGSSNWLMFLAMLPFYFLVAFPAFFPWSIHFPAAWQRLLGQRSDADRYLLSGLAVIFVFFTISITKLPHYTLPALPLLACAVAPSITTRSIRLGAVGMVALNLLSASVLFPIAEKSSPNKALAASPLLQPGTRIAAVDYSEPGLVWYLRARVQSDLKKLKRSDVPGFLQESGPAACILPTEQLPKLSLDPAWQVVSTRGFDIAKGRFINLSMIVNHR
ncbi:MAG: glycosyltransferase family 39 protein [Chthoniobacteraceae bacterium]